jgi:hypothetical protein
VKWKGFIVISNKRSDLGNLDVWNRHTLLRKVRDDSDQILWIPACAGMTTGQEKPTRVRLDVTEYRSGLRMKRKGV